MPTPHLSSSGVERVPSAQILLRLAWFGGRRRNMLNTANQIASKPKESTSSYLGKEGFCSSFCVASREDLFGWSFCTVSKLNFNHLMDKRTEKTEWLLRLNKPQGSLHYNPLPPPPPRAAFMSCSEIGFIAPNRWGTGDMRELSNGTRCWPSSSPSSRRGHAES